MPGGSLRTRPGHARACALPAGILALMCARPLAAQTIPPPPADEVSFLVGRVSLFPAFVLRDVGFDSNVFNASDDPKEDFTLTAQPRLRAALPVGGARLTGSATLGFVYYATYKDEQAVNRLFEGRLEATASRVRPYVAGSYNHARERSGAEIDARVLRHETTVSGGAEFKLTGITSITGLYRRLTYNYDDDERFLDALLADQLNRSTDLAGAGVRYAITPLTTLVVDVEAQRDRFDRSPIRDADSVRVMPAVELAPDAVVTGRVAAGFRRFTPSDSRLSSFQGLVAAANATYSLLGVTRVSVEATRDVMYSFHVATPYYLLTGGRLTVSQRIFGPTDLIVIAGQDRLEYRAVAGLAAANLLDRTTTLGGGLGFRLGQSLRLALIYDRTERVSNALDSRRYQRERVFASVTFGQ